MGHKQNVFKHHLSFIYYRLFSPFNHFRVVKHLHILSIFPSFQIKTPIYCALKNRFSLPAHRRAEIQPSIYNSKLLQIACRIEKTMTRARYIVIHTIMSSMDISIDRNDERLFFPTLFYIFKLGILGDISAYM